VEQREERIAETDTAGFTAQTMCMVYDSAIVPGTPCPTHVVTHTAGYCTGDRQGSGRVTVPSSTGDQPDNAHQVTRTHIHAHKCHRSQAGHSDESVNRHVLCPSSITTVLNLLPCAACMGEDYLKVTRGIS
jgi:hypothetical protein